MAGQTWGAPSDGPNSENSLGLVDQGQGLQNFIIPRKKEKKEVTIKVLNILTLGKKIR